MLLQEYVSDLLSPNIPEGWEEQMSRAKEQDEYTRRKKGRKAGRGRVEKTQAHPESDEDTAQTTDEEAHSSQSDGSDDEDEEETDEEQSTS